MAKDKQNEIIEERSVKVKAKVNLKYDKDVIKTGKEFLVRDSDVKAIKDYVEVLERPEPKTE